MLMQPTISWITVSRDPAKLAALRASLRVVFDNSPLDTYEVLPQDGSQPGACIFKSYNQGAAQAQGEILGFVHDDVEFLCNWKSFEKPLELLRKPGTGVAGAAGTRVLPDDAKWWGAPMQECRGAVAHPSHDADNPFGFHYNMWPWQTAQYGRVAVVDGVLLLISRRTFERVGGFDEKTFSGFHYYDMELCTRLHSLGKTNYVAPIPLLHHSPGVPGPTWETNRQLFLAKYRPYLPLQV